MELTRENLFRTALLSAARARSLGFALEGGLLYFLSRAVPGGKPGDLERDPEFYRALHELLLDMLRRDSANIEAGIYPVSVLTPERPWAHLLRLPRLLLDGARIVRRREKGATTQFRQDARKRLQDLPRYYRRNFHFQTDGYLSKESAELYDHQVDILFLGATDAMRRLILPPMKARLQPKDGQGLRILEIGAGTGRATSFVRQAFPGARITALDLSEPYLQHAREKLSRFEGIDFMQGDGGDLPFKAGQFDAVFSVFLFHELPLEARRAVLRESVRVARPGGFVGLVDSVQAGDRPQFERALESFSRDFHEPFYRNYLANPMPTLMTEAGVQEVQHDLGYFSKVVWGSAPR